MATTMDLWTVFLCGLGLGGGVGVVLGIKFNWSQCKAQQEHQLALMDRKSANAKAWHEAQRSQSNGRSRNRADRMVNHDADGVVIDH